MMKKYLTAFLLSMLCGIAVKSQTAEVYFQQEIPMQELQLKIIPKGFMYIGEMAFTCL